MDGLDHVYWLSGGFCAGKTTVSRILEDRCGVAVYHTDEHRRELFAEIDEEAYPESREWREYLEAEGLDERFRRHLSMRMEGETGRIVLGGFRGMFAVLADRLREMSVASGQEALLVESAHSYPQFLQEWVDRRRVIYLIAPPDLIVKRSEMRRSAWEKNPERVPPDLRRIKWTKQLSDLQNGSFVNRSAFIERTAREYGLPILEIHEGMSVEQVALHVQEHFGLECR